MKFVRFERDAKPYYGLLKGDTVVQLDGSIYGEWQKTACVFPVGSLKLLSPCEPTKVVCVGTNYMCVVREKGDNPPAEPVIFLKPSSAVIGPEESIIFPDVAKELNYEVELAVVIKKQAKDITPQEADEYILGYTCANDITAKDFMEKGKPWTKAKCFDTFMPLGPCIATGLNSADLVVEMYHNGSRTQHESTGDMIFTAQELVAYVSKIMTLYPGDVISTGTPTGKGKLAPGDTIEARIAGIGSLKNYVR